MPPPVSRHTGSGRAHNTLVIRTVEVYFQLSPQRPAGAAAARGIKDLDWRVLSGSSVIDSGRTGTDGKVVVPLHAGQPSRLQLLVAGKPVASYLISERTLPGEAANTLKGQQRRLYSMGYQLGPGAVDGLMGRYLDRALLEFQGDQAQDMTGVVNAAIQTQLTNQAGY